MNKRDFLKSLALSVPVLSFLPFNPSKAKAMLIEKEEFWKISAIIDGLKWHFNLKKGDVFVKSAFYIFKCCNDWQLRIYNDHINIEHYHGHSFIIEKLIPPNDRKNYFLSIVEIYPNNYAKGMIYPVDYDFSPITSPPSHFI